MKKDWKPDLIGCADQAAHNLLLQAGALDPVNRLENFAGLTRAMARRMRQSA